MRRQANIIQQSGSYIDYLRSLGCIFYFDAAYNNYYDQINNVPITLSGNGSFSYNSNKQAFYCKTPSSANQYIGIWNNGMSSSTFPGNNWTSINIIEPITKTNGKYLPSFGVNTLNRAYASQFCTFYNMSNKVANFPNEKFSTATVYNYDTSMRYFYQNGSFYTSNAYNTNHQPSNWVLNSSGTCLGIVCDVGYDGDIEWYAYRTAIFNTALSWDTISSIINAPSSLPNIPFAENCVFYAPLDEGDLSDHISGTLPHGTSNSNITWDSEKNMYVFECSKVWGYAALWDNLNMGLSNNQPITICIDAIEDTETFSSSTTNRYNSMIGTPKWTSRITTMYICHYRYDTSFTAIGTLHRYVAVFEGSNLIFYKDGNYISSYTWNGEQFSRNEVTLCLIPNNNTYYKMWAKNARVYNRAMTSAEVAQL